MMEQAVVHPNTTYQQNKATSMAKRLKDKMNRISKIEQQQQPQQQEEVSETSLIQFPWDDDQFSLCLDNFPNPKWAKKYYNSPKTKSPLRKHWEEDDASDEEEHASSVDNSVKEKEEASISIISTSTSSISSAVQSDSSTNAEKDGPTKKKKRKPKLSLFFKKNINSSFPYNNDTNFLNRIEEEATVKEVPQQKGRVEHVSPLLNNVALTDSLIYGSPTLSPIRKISGSTSSLRSKQPSISSGQYKSSYHGGSVNGGSINGQSTISETGTVESWKMVRSPTTGLTSPIVLPTIISKRQQYSPTPSHEYKQFQYPPSRSGTVTPSTIASSGAMTPLQQPLYYSHSIHSGYSNGSVHYFPSPVASQASSYRSIRVPKNADELVYYSNTPSLYSTDVGSEYTEKNRSYSQYFNPRYSSHKKSKRSNSLLSRLIRNIKQHFVKQQPQEL